MNKFNMLVVAIAMFSFGCAAKNNHVETAHDHMNSARDQAEETYDHSHSRVHGMVERAKGAVSGAVVTSMEVWEDVKTEAHEQWEQVKDRAEQQRKNASKRVRSE